MVGTYLISIIYVNDFITTALGKHPFCHTFHVYKNVLLSQDKNSPPRRGGAERRGGSMRNRNAYFSLPYNPKLRERAKELRKAGNLCEVLLWQQLHKNKFRQYDFDRQKIIGNYIVDFFCGNCGVVIEIDGKSHDNKIEYDNERNAYLEGLGLIVIHIIAQDVLYNLDGVMKMLYNHPALRTPLQGGE
jgi:very-short-patch-repair endonuclease